MIIHNPKISGSLQFPSDLDGNLLTLEVSNGTIDTKTLNSSGVDQNVQPSINLSGSFSGSFVGDGSGLTGVSAINIDALNALGGASVAQGDSLVISDAGTEKKVTFSNLEDSLFGNVSGDITIAAGGVSTIGEVSGHIIPSAHNTYDLGSTSKYWRDLYLSSGSLYINGIQVLSTDGTDLTFQTDAGESVKILETGNDTITLESVNGDITLTATGTGNIELDAPIQIAAGKNILSSDGNAIAFSDDVNLGSNNIFAGNLSGIVSGSSQISGITNSQLDGSISNDKLAGSIANNKLANSSITIDGATISLGGSVSTLQIGTSSSTALAGDTALLQLGSTSSTALVGNTTTISGAQASAITANTAKVEYTDALVKTKLDAEAVISGSSQVSYNSITDTPTTISGGQASAITANTAKISYNSTASTKLGTIEESADVTDATNVTAAGALMDSEVTNLAQVKSFDSSDYLASSTTTISGAQASAITANTAKTGITSGQASAITTNSAKTGISSAQASAIEANTAKTSDINHNVTTNLSISGTSGARTIESSDGTNAIIPIATTSVSGLLSPGLFDEIDANTAKISYNSAASTKLATIEEGAEENVVDSVAGKTGVVSLVKGDVGLGNVDNTADSAKPVSTAGQSALNLKANLASPALTGTPSAPTAASNTNTTQIATTAYVQTELTELIGGAPGTLDTLNELAAAINDDSDYSSTLTTALGTKLVKSSNLSDLTSASTARTNLGLGTAAVSNTGDFLASSVTTISSGQASAITANTAKTGISSGQASAITANTAKTGITSGQASAITANTAKISYNSTASTKLATIEEGATADQTKADINALDITELGTITSGVWNGSVIASAKLDADTAHLSGTQTFTGAKTFSSTVTSSSKTTGAVIVTGGVGIGGALNVGGDVVAYASSDERLKDNIELISNPIEKVQSLKGVTWDWNSNADILQQTLPNVGVIAQDVEKVLPQLVIDRDNGFKGVDYAKLTGLLIEAVKDQQKQIDELKSKLS